MNPKFLLPEDGSWVGPPLMRLKTINTGEVVLDGRRRLKEYHYRGLKTDIPVFYARSHAVAIKHLILNGHPDRAALHAVTFAPQLAQRSSSSLNSLLDLGHNKLQPYIRALKDPKERHKLPRRAMSVVVKARALHKRMVEGDTNISINDVEDILGEFLE